jgi:hypothetical protein
MFYSLLNVNLLLNSMHTSINTITIIHHPNFFPLHDSSTLHLRLNIPTCAAVMTCSKRALALLVYRRR